MENHASVNKYIQHATFFILKHLVLFITTFLLVLLINQLVDTSNSHSGRGVGNSLSDTISNCGIALILIVIKVPIFIIVMTGVLMLVNYYATEFDSTQKNKNMGDRFGQIFVSYSGGALFCFLLYGAAVSLSGPKDVNYFLVFAPTYLFVYWIDSLFYFKNFGMVRSLQVQLSSGDQLGNLKSMKNILEVTEVEPQQYLLKAHFKYDLRRKLYEASREFGFSVVKLKESKVKWSEDSTDESIA